MATRPRAQHLGDLSSIDPVRAGLWSGRDLSVSHAVALPLAGDVTEPGQTVSAVDRALEELDQIDILVNNAGGPIFNAPFLEIRPEGWRRAVELNLLSVVGFCHAVGAHMVARRAGSVINIDSLGATRPAPLRAHTAPRRQPSSTSPRCSRKSGRALTCE